MFGRVHSRVFVRTAHSWFSLILLLLLEKKTSFIFAPVFFLSLLATVSSYLSLTSRTIPNNLALEFVQIISASCTRYQLPHGFMRKTQFELSTFKNILNIKLISRAMECFEMEKIIKDLQVHKSSSNQFRGKSCNLIALEQVYKFLQI